jgi:hypothetical protein
MSFIFVVFVSGCGYVEMYISFLLMPESGWSDFGYGIGKDELEDCIELLLCDG